MSAKHPPSAKPKKSFRELIRETWGPYKQLLPYVKPYRLRLIFGILCGAAAGGANMLFLLSLNHVGKMVWPNGGGPSKGLGGLLKHSQHAAETVANTVSLKMVVGTCALIPIVMILRSALTYLNSYSVSWVSLRLLNDLRNDLFAKLIGQSMSFFNKAQSGQLITRVVNDSRVAQTALTTVSSDLVVQPCTLVSALAALLYLDWKFTLVSFVLFPVCLIPITVLGRRVRRIGADEEAGTGGLMVVLQEAFSGIRVVKALARENFEIQDFNTAGEEQIRNSFRVRRSIEMIGPVIEAISAVGAWLALIYCWAGGVDAGTFLSLIGGMFFLYEPAKKLSKVHLQIQKALASTQRIFDLINLKPDVQDAPDALALPRSQGEITLENVTFGYRSDRDPAVAGINLHIQPGKTYALVGQSGSGKSTMISLILRFYDPQTGTIRIDGHDLRSITQQSLRQNIAIVTQDTFLFHTTIMENIRYGRLDATDEEVYAAAQQAFAHEFICAQPEGYKTKVGDKGCMLSGGQQQRIAIARALLKNAPILLLDEATSALDSESEQKIQIALERLAAGRTVIAIAHRLSTILNSDQIVVMNQGRIMEVGTHTELFEKSGHYRHLYDLQFGKNTETEVVG